LSVTPYLHRFIMDWSQVDIRGPFRCYSLDVHTPSSHQLYPLPQTEYTLAITRE